MNADQINALPQEVRDYIMQLETECDPQGTIRENYHMKGQIEALRKIIDDEKAERRQQVYCAALAGMLANPKITPSHDSMDIGATVRRAETLAKESIFIP